MLFLFRKRTGLSSYKASVKISLFFFHLKKELKSSPR